MYGGDTLVTNLSKKRILEIVFFLLVFVVVFCFTYFVWPFNGDELWNYGFAYNISVGMIPYSDFNMVITPFYSFFNAFFLFVFGNHLYVMHIINAFMITFCFYLFYKSLGAKKTCILFPLFLLVSTPGYNLFCLILVIFFLYLSNLNFKYKDLCMSFLVSILFLTKQTIGIFILIPYLYYSKNRVKSFLYFLIPIMIFVFYLLWNHAFYSFINYTFLGLFDFGKSNSDFSFFFFFLIMVVYLCYLLFKSRFQDSFCFYVLAFQVVMIPIFDWAHFLLGFLLFLYFVLSRVRIKKYQFKYFIFISFFALFCFYYVLYGRDSFSFYPSKTSYLYGRSMSAGVYEELNFIHNYLDDREEEFDYLFIFSSWSYLIKLDMGYDINKYDLINNGNMGYHGSVRYISQIEDQCAFSKCLFLVNRDELDSSQLNSDIVSYVYDHYEIYDHIGFDVFTNY